MRYISCKLDDLKKIVLPIGYEGENEHTRVQVDAGEVFKEYPAAVPSLKVHGPTGAIYPATVTRNGNSVIWDIKASDCAADGSGEAQFTFTNNSVIVKSCIAKIKVYRSIVGGSTPPDPVQDWLDEAQDVLDDLEAAEVHQPMIGVDGYWYTWDQENEEYTKTETKAQGEDGQPGPAGQDGAPGQDATPALITVNYSDLTFPVAKDTQCYHDGLLYYAKQDIQTSEAWTAAHWQQTTVEEQQRLLLNDIQGITNKEKLMQIRLSANEIRIRYHYDADNDLLTVWDKSSNGNIRPAYTYKGAKGLEWDALENSSYLIHTWYDSENPLYSLPSNTWWNIFANHGYLLPYVTKAGHGKTNADIGSVWQDTNGKEFTLIFISGNNLWFAPKVTQNADGITGKTVRDWDRYVSIGTLSHVSGATHTDSIDTTTQGSAQRYPLTESNGINVLLDGNLTSTEGIYEADQVDILQTMTCYDPATIPFNAIMPTIDLSNADVMCYITNAFTVVGGSTTYRATLDVKKPIYLGSTGSWGANQGIHPSPASGETEYRFCPRCKNQDAPTQQKTDGTTGFYVMWNPSWLYDMKKPIDRMVSYIVDGNDEYKIGFASGLSLVSGDTRDFRRDKFLTPDNTNGSRLLQWMGDSQNKGYFAVIDGSKFSNGIVPSGTVCEVTSYFVHYNPDENIGQVYWYKDGDQWVIYAHCQSAQDNMKIKLPDVMEGMNVAVVDKTDGSTLIGTVVSDGCLNVKFESAGATLLKNYIVLKTVQYRDDERDKFVGNIKTDLGTHTDTEETDYVNMTAISVTVNSVTITTTKDSLTVYGTPSAVFWREMQPSFSAPAGDYEFDIGSNVNAPNLSIQVLDSSNNIISQISSLSAVSKVAFTLYEAKTLWIRALYQTGSLIDESHEIHLYKVNTETGDNDLAYLGQKFNVLRKGITDQTGSLEVLKKNLFPLCTFIDDDTVNVDHVTNYTDACGTAGIKGSLATLTIKWENNAALLSALKTAEQEGHSVIIHAYSQDLNDCWSQTGFDAQECTENLIKGMQMMAKEGFINYKLWATPSSRDNSEMRTLSRRAGVECRFIGENWANDGTHPVDRFRIFRVALNVSDATGMTIAQIKALADACYSANGWLVVMTHFANENQNGDYADRLVEIAEYVKGKGYKVANAAEAWSYRKWIYDLHDMF